MKTLYQLTITKENGEVIKLHHKAEKLDYKATLENVKKNYPNSKAFINAIGKVNIYGNVVLFR